MAFRGKVALVTGAGSGMGRIIAKRLAAGGAKVAALDVNEPGLAETAAGHDGIRTYRCDVTSWEDVQDVVGRVERDLGTIDRAVHAAGIMPTAPILDMDVDVIRRLMRVNYEGTVHLTKAVVPAMVARKGGDFMIFGSLAGFVLAPHLGAYNASKAAVNAFAEVLFEENRGSGVRFLLACPPMTNTPLISQATLSSNPRSVQIGVERNMLADPEKIVDALEESLEKGEEVSFATGQAKALFRMRRFTPRLLWWIIKKTEQS